MRRLALLLAVSFPLAATPALADAALPGAAVSYIPPVDAPVVDAFRAPTVRWGAGNRGIDYAPGAGTPVRAAADGEVVFAGQVGGHLHVVVLHADGVRTSYSFLQSFGVHRGERVRQGQPVGSSGGELHFGARLGDVYIDPSALFGKQPPDVSLVPDNVRRPGSEAEERSGLARFLADVSAAAGRSWRAATRNGEQIGRTALDVGTQVATDLVELGRQELASKVDELRGVLHYARQVAPLEPYRLARTTYSWWRQSQDCTPVDVRPPPLPERRVALLVGGLGSSSSKDAMGGLDTDALGYAPADLVRFSYKGGTTAEQPYDAADTTVDLHTSAKRLREVLERVHREHPGVPVDLIGYDQGGLVARTTLAYEYDPNDARLPKVANLVTLGSPHRGADFATALNMVGHTNSGQTVEWIASELGVSPFDLRGESVRQLSETSRFLAKLRQRSLPEGIGVTSIGARGDLVVSANHTSFSGARNVVVSVPGGTTDHSRLPGSEAGQREVALAVAGLPPTCQELTDMMLDTAVADAISTGEDLLGAGLWVGGHWVDGVMKRATKGPRTDRKY